MNPRDIIDQLNAQKPQCPVLFTDIKFSYRDAKERAQNVVEKLDQDVDLTQSYGRYRPIHIPIVDYSDVNEENRSYVFPSCGHVHGYHKSLEHHACPLCRTYGSFVPIAFAFEPSLNMATCTQSEDASSQGPTHVFNPCGHVASLATCEYWSDLKVFCKQFYTPSQFLPRNNPTHADQHGNPFDPIEYHAICPFCCTELHPRKPFSRLILQAEQGFAWEQNDADQADISLTSPMQATAASWDNESYRQQYLTSQRLLFQREFGERQTRSDGKNHPVGLFRSLHFPSICCPDSSHHE